MRHYDIFMSTARHDPGFIRMHRRHCETCVDFEPELLDDFLGQCYQRVSCGYHSELMNAIYLTFEECEYLYDYCDTLSAAIF